MDYSDEVPSRTRGTAILVMTLIIVAGTGGIYLIGPRNGLSGTSSVRVAVIDSGITPDQELEQRIVAERSFVEEGYGYGVTDNTTEDSAPSGVEHGTIVARIVAENSPTARIVNAKVVSAQNQATVTAIVDAIYWAVEQNCSVINLSLGGPPSSYDLVGEAALWAFSRGVVVVAAAGNGGDDGVAGSSVESPALLPEVIGVGGVDENLQLYGFSGRGPLRDASVKPDIVSFGYYTGVGGTVFGTSFASPRVAAAAAEIVTYCHANGWKWTPGMVKALLLASSRKLSSQPYEVGSGFLDLEAAKAYLENVPRREGLPLVACVLPSLAPYDFERWFINSSSRVVLTAYTSTNDTWMVTYAGSGSPYIGGPDIIEINQTKSFGVRIHVMAGRRIDDLRIQIKLSSADYRYVSCHLQFDAGLPLAKIAFDVSHTPWSIDSIYGQFREFYETATDLGMAIEEIGWQSNITLRLLMEYEAVVVLDPCAYDTYRVNGTLVRNFRNYTSAEINAYRQYWEAGRGLFIVGLTNESIHLPAANTLLSEFGMSLNYDRLPQIRIVINSIESTLLVTDFEKHPVTHSIDSIDYVGCSINITGAGFPLAWTTVRVQSGSDYEYELRTLVAGLTSTNGSRLICSGSNYFLDNWGILGEYSSDDNDDFVRQILLWLIGVI
ncbi:hypothetical protein EU545_03505 [Candidatus Thorarchaeota archaeon]|nr:MAG: hypothetical protein EU545_03505 [Candidatus Thorarchaeota archaeon]